MCSVCWIPWNHSKVHRISSSQRYFVLHVSIPRSATSTCELHLWPSSKCRFLIWHPWNDTDCFFRRIWNQGEGVAQFWCSDSRTPRFHLQSLLAFSWPCIVHTRCCRKCAPPWRNLPRMDWTLLRLAGTVVKYVHVINHPSRGSWTHPLFFLSKRTSQNPW